MTGLSSVDGEVLVVVEDEEEAVLDEDEELEIKEEEQEEEGGGGQCPLHGWDHQPAETGRPTNMPDGVSVKS